MGALGDAMLTSTMRPSSAPAAASAAVRPCDSTNLSATPVALLLTHASTTKASVAARKETVRKLGSSTVSFFASAAIHTWNCRMYSSSDISPSHA